jgi:Xaa-Pro aminopeptidase
MSERPKVSHDTQAPAKLLDFMLQRWKPKSGKLPSPLRAAANFKRRRETLSKAFPGETLIVPTGHLKVRSNDDHYRFRPGTDFYYLTGNLEPDCALVMVPEGASGHRAVLFVEPNPGKTDATFFTDRIKGELWEGARLGVPESRALYGVEDTRPLSELSAFVKSAIASAKSSRIVRGHSAIADAWLPANARDQELAAFLSEMRLIKDKEELKELQSAVNATQLAFEDVIRRIKSAKSERELEGVFWTRARMEGNDVGYGSIVASGAHACTLHWKHNNGTLKKGDLLLLDAGVEGNSLYTADITRTLPLNGKYSREQRAIYQLVLEAQAAAFKEVKPGRDFMAPNRAAMRVLAEGLERLGILPTSAEEALRDENQFYKRYSLHNVSHMLGLDVHDCAQARAETYKYGELAPGMVLTVEPGLYFQPDDLTVPTRYRGIGVRIEDDVVVTERGYRNLSGGIPSQPEDVERWMKKLWKK